MCDIFTSVQRPQWLPTRSDVPGIAVSVMLGLATMGAARALPPSPYVSDVLFAIVLGALVLNTPIGRLFGVKRPGAEHGSDPAKK